MKPLAIVLEDDPGLRHALTALMESSDCSAIAAKSTAEALDVLQSQPVDVLLTDIYLPGDMDGIALAKKVLEFQPRVAVYLMSCDHDIPARLIPKGATFLPKPVRAGTLETIIEAAQARWA